MQFSIEIQKDLTEEEHELADDYAYRFVNYMAEHDNHYPLKGSGGRRSYLRRNRLGYRIEKSDLVFRRISKRLRKFGIFRIDTMIERGGGEINTNQCMCPIHLGGTRVVWRDKKPESYIYHLTTQN